MPGITGEVICRLFCPGSAGLVSRRTNALAASLEGAGRIELRTEAGTELELSIAGRKIYTDTGLYREPGRFGNLPAGEVSAAPVSFSARGRVVVDLAFAGLGAVDGLILELEKGRIVAAKGPGRGRLLKLLAENRDRVAGEFGIGTNPLARPSSLTLEAEKAVGTVHLGLGDNISFGGENRATGHWDAVLNCRWIKVDGEILDLTEPLV